MALLRISILQQLTERINRLSPDTKALWGKMTVAQMLAHCAASIQMAYGDIPSKIRTSKWTAFTTTLLYVELLPFPKKAMAPPEINLEKKLKCTGSFEEEKVKLIEQLNRTATTPADYKFKPHPVFHKLSHRQWGKLAFKHIDYHLRQFGV